MDYPDYSIENPHLLPEQKKLRKICVIAFMFSEGDLLFDKNFFAVLRSRNLLPSVPEAKGEQRKALKNYPSYILDIYPPAKHAEQREDMITMVQEGLWEHYVEVLQSDSSELNAEEAVGYLLRTIVERDLIYQETAQNTLGYKLHKRAGRPAEITPDQVDTENDPHASLFRRYIVNGNRIGLDEAQLVLQLIKDAHPIEYSENTLYRDHYEALKREWERNHPGLQFEEPKDQVDWVIR
jgi:hypothetical protein